LSKRAKALLASSSVTKMSQSFMAAQDFLYDSPALAAQPLDGLNTTYYARGIGEVYARSGWDKNATWVTMKGGAYTESHAHQDQGSLMVYKGGWLIHDANTMSKSGLAQATTAHSVVRIDNAGTPVKQIVNTFSKMQTLKKGANFVYMSADLTPSYKGNAAVQKVHRDLLFVQPNIIIVFDRVQTPGTTTQTWQLPSPVAPVVSGNTATFTNAGHSLKVQRISPATATASVYNYASTTEFTAGFRYDAKVTGGDNRFLHVMGIDGAVSSAAATGTSGVTVNVAGGGQVTVHFNRDTAGATVTINGATTTIGATVDVLAE
nr:heparinase II/III family protein [Deltaproteobacteria bacterium]